LPASKTKAKAGAKTGSKAGAKAKSLKTQAQTIERVLRKAYPDAHCELDFRSPLELAVATILSAQCTDKRVNMVTPALFARFPTAAALAAAGQSEVEALIKSTGFFRNKAKSIIGMANAVVAKHGGEIPRTMDELFALPGIGRKTANVILGNAFGINEGIVVDTHVARLSKRLGLTRHTDPVKIELALMPLLPKTSWALLSHLLIWHGRRVCDAKKPRCADCVLRRICPSAA
jgi:endonuclease-3